MFGSWKTKYSGCCPPSESCEGKSEACVPFEHGQGIGGKLTALWVGAFFDALHQAKVERLRARIEKKFGDKLDKGADLVVEAAEAFRQSCADKEKRFQDLHKKLSELFEDKG